MDFPLEDFSLYRAKDGKRGAICVSGMAMIEPDWMGEDWTVTAITLEAHGWGASGSVDLPKDHPLFAMIADALRDQCDDIIFDRLVENGDLRRPRSDFDEHSTWGR